MSDAFYCKICEISCNGKAPYEQHISSAKHLKKVKTYQGESSPASSIPSTPIFRELPSSASSSSSLNTFPFPSNSVTLSAETMKILLEWKHPRGYLPFCDLCHLPLHGTGTADIHFDEKNQLHKQKSLNYQQIQTNSAPYSCKVCLEIFPNDDLMFKTFPID